MAAIDTSAAPPPPTSGGPTAAFTATHCERCGATLLADALAEGHEARCGRCGTGYRHALFPALAAYAAATPDAAPVGTSAAAALGARLEAGDAASCFFHDHNAAEEACSHCGRYLCTTCTIPLGALRYCGDCIARLYTTAATPESAHGGGQARGVAGRYLRYDAIAGGLLGAGVGLSITIVFAIFGTPLLWAAAAVGIYGWKRNGSPLDRHHISLGFIIGLSIIAGIAVPALFVAFMIL